MAYQKPVIYAKTNQAIFTDYGQEVELQKRIVADKPNDNFVGYRNANSRVFLKNGQVIRLLAEIDGQVDLEYPLATGTAFAKLGQLQPFYVRFRIEEPIAETNLQEPALREEIL